MKKKRFDLVLALTVVAAIVLLGAAVWYAVLRPDSNWYVVQGVVLPENGILDCWVSAFYLFFTALACFAGGLHYDKDDEKSKDGGDGACP